METKTLNDWLLSYYDRDNKTLDLRLRYLTYTDWVCPYPTSPSFPYPRCTTVTIRVEDPAFSVYLPLFTERPEQFLDKFEVKNLSLCNEASHWNPATQLKPLVSNRNFNLLDLHHNLIHNEDAICLQNQMIAKLDVSNNLISSSGAHALAANPYLEAIDLGYNAVSDKGAMSFQNNHHLKALYIDGNKLSSQGGNAISTITSLEKLDISYNAIGDAAGVAIAKNLKNLKEINLKQTKIGPNTVKELLKNENLTKAHVCWHEVGLFNKLKLWGHTQHNRKKEKEVNKGNKQSFSFFSNQKEQKESERKIKKHVNRLV